MCNGVFQKRYELKLHMKHHPESTTQTWKCEVCAFPFPDENQLERHKIQTGHMQDPKHFWCDKCKLNFPTVSELDKHKRFPSKCSDAFQRLQPKKKAENFNPQNTFGLPEDTSSAADASVAPSSLIHASQEGDGPHCSICKKTFASLAQYNRHWLGCRPTSLNTLNQAPPTVQQDTGPAEPPKASPKASPKAKAPEPPKAKASAPAAQPPTVRELKCDFKGCGRTFRTEQGMNMHKVDAHGIGGQGLDLYGKDAWMLNQRERERAKQQGLLRNPGHRNAQVLHHGNVPHQGNAILGKPKPPFSQHVAQIALNAKGAPRPPQPIIPMPPVAAAPPGNQGGSGPEDAEQAETVAGKIMRLNLQADVVIQHTGEMNYSGLGFPRIGVSRQGAIASNFEDLCHLPRFLQNDEFVPAPTTLKDDYQHYNAVGNFKNSPDPSPTHPGLAVVAVACGKIKMTDGSLEAVKIAAVDVASCRILMNHLMCGNPSASVENWNTQITGLRSFADMEAARKDGYKILRGWQAARAALWKFVDKETIIIGHNLRADLDALRMIHGRAIDVAQVFEQDAKGPLSRQQVSLESLSRGLLEKELPTDPRFGRDVLINAFAARELALCRIKFHDKWVRWAKTKSLEYQRVNPGARK